ncbi:MAG: zinc dependent phospholipase C family protein [Candidatus Enterenecus sp.]
MPNYFTHLTFGARVLDALPSALRAVLEEERPAFDLGCLGPDILFFYHPLTRNPARLEGLEMHKRSALPAFQRLRAAVEEDMPMSRGYAAGFLCHLALDSACHPYVNGTAAQGEITHLAIEAEFDRLLMERSGLETAHAHMPEPPGGAAYRAAARAYTQAGPKETKQGFLAMRRDTELLARLYGTGLGRLADRACHWAGPLKGAAGVVLAGEPAAACADSNLVLMSLLEETVPPAAEQIRRFFEAVERGAELDGWLDRDFSGVVYTQVQTTG